ncbi:hypothetical protein ACFU9Y_23590 [Streptomyces sp. NPDC057621]
MRSTPARKATRLVRLPVLVLVLVLVLVHNDCQWPAVPSRG